MYITSLILHKISSRSLYIQLSDAEGNTGWGEVAPLPNWSLETLDQCIEQLKTFTGQNSRELYPSVSFGLESALLSLFSPLSDYTVPVATLLKGPDILEEAKLKHQQGYTIAKLKVGLLPFEEAAPLIHELKNIFTLRIDVNRAWSTKESLNFFSQFPLDTFDYVEEPFRNPHDLDLFSHPLAVDESLRDTFTLAQLETIPSLKTLVYKPTLSGGLSHCLPYYKWAKEKNLDFVLSSCFESPLGLSQITAMASRLGLTTPVGIGQ